MMTYQRRLEKYEYSISNLINTNQYATENSNIKYTFANLQNIKQNTCYQYVDILKRLKIPKYI